MIGDNMKKKQSGVSLSGLLMTSVILAIVALFGMKVIPSVIEYFQIVKTVKSISADTKNQSVADVRRAYDRYAAIDNISSVRAQDLEVTKEGNDLVISFAYERRIPLFSNASLLLDFSGSNKD